MIENADLPRGRDAVGKTWPGLNLVLKDSSYHLAIVMAGTNDLGHGYESQDITANLHKIYETIKSNNVDHVLAIGIPDSAFLKHSEEVEAKRDAVNGAIEAYAEDSKGFATYMDCPIKYTEGTNLYEGGGLHFTKEGYELLAENIMPKVLEIMDSL